MLTVEVITMIVVTKTVRDVWYEIRTNDTRGMFALGVDTWDGKRYVDRQGQAVYLLHYADGVRLI